MVLRSGKTITGEVVLSNDEVVILRQKDGSRFQLPRQEVAMIQAEEQPTRSTHKRDSLTKQTNIGLHISMAGGTTYTANGWGGFVQPSLFIGTHQLHDLPIAIGGSISYHGVFAQGKAFSWIPLQAALQYPLGKDLDSEKRYPILGASIGYAIATSQEWGGGICAGASFGWSFPIASKSRLQLSLMAQCLQTRMQVTETIHGDSYQNMKGCTLVNIGIKLGIQI